MRQLRQIFTLA